MSDLEPIGPTDPTLRDYVTDVGVLTTNYSRLERHIRQALDTVKHLVDSGIAKVPDEFIETYSRRGPRNLGRLIDEMKALGVDEELAQQLGQVNADRIDVIHRAAELLSEDYTIDYDKVHKERQQLRKVLKRCRNLFTEIQKVEYELFEGLLLVAGGTLKEGASDPRLAEMQELLGKMRESIDRKVTHTGTS